MTWKRLLISGSIVGIFFAGGLYYKKEKDIMMQRERRRAMGKAAIGGEFELVGVDGKSVSSKDFLGQWVLIYFGFTHCPDICPDELEKMANVVDLLEANGKKITPLFISVDPDRDTPEAVKGYISEFSPKLIGLTGNKEQVNKATRAYRVYYSAGPPDPSNDYIVDHTIITYLIDPEGRFVDYYGQSKEAQEMFNGIKMSMSKYDMLNKKSWF